MKHGKEQTARPIHSSDRTHSSTRSGSRLKVFNTERNRDIEVVDCWTDGVPNQLAKDVRRGLMSARKYLPSKYFYDSRGSKLFDRICDLPEYYLTRTEIALLEDKAGSIMRDFRRGDLVELGSGGNSKIRTLLDALDRKARSLTRYVPVDVSKTAIVEAGLELVEIYPELSVMGVVGDFMRDLNRLPQDRPKLMLFLGSTIGNLTPKESRTFLTAVAECLRSGDRFLLGLDMVKSEEVLEAAYNDAEGITAEFNRNILHVLNRELGADFRQEHFDHLAFFNRDEEQMEMHLRANRPAQVEIAQLDLTVIFEEGETIHTEICRKFRKSSAKRMIEDSGLKVACWHTDADGWFALADLVPA